MAADTGSIAFAVFAPGRGLRFATYTGIVGQLVESDKGTPYRNDMGYPIGWKYETGWMQPERRSRIVGCRTVVENLLASADPAVDAHETEFLLTTDDQGAGYSTFLFERPAQQHEAATPVYEQWNLTPWRALPGVRHWLKVASRNAAQRIEALDLSVEAVDGGGGD